MADISSSSSDHDHDVSKPPAPPTTTCSTPTPSPSPTAALAPARALAASTIIPQKRPYEGEVANPSSKRPVGPAIPPKPVLKLKPPREKKDSWKKKEAAAAAVAVTPGGVGGTGTVIAVEGGINTVGSILQLPSPGLQRWRLPKPQAADYEGARPPLVMPSNLPGADINCEFVSLSEQCVSPPPLPFLSLSLSPRGPYVNIFYNEKPVQKTAAVSVTTPAPPPTSSHLSRTAFLKSPPSPPGSHSKI